MASEIDLEKLCKAALAKLGLKLVVKKDGSSSNAMYIVEADDASQGQQWTMMYAAMAGSVNCLASRLFKLDESIVAYWWPSFRLINTGDGRMRIVKNVFAGKSLEEVQVMVDFM